MLLAFSDFASWSRFALRFTNALNAYTRTSNASFRAGVFCHTRCVCPFFTRSTAFSAVNAARQHHCVLGKFASVNRLKLLHHAV
tara:strand:- start:1 stop:252 length:252 start_codon:yes stop_codon:yes gene_type:complete